MKYRYRARVIWERGKIHNKPPTLTVQALLTKINLTHRRLCHVLTGSPLSLGSFSSSFPVGGVWMQTWASITCLYWLFPLWHIGLIEQGRSSPPEVSWVLLQLGCGCFSIAGEKEFGSISNSCQRQRDQLSLAVNHADLPWSFPRCC